MEGKGFTVSLKAAILLLTFYCKALGILTNHLLGYKAIFLSGVAALIHGGLCIVAVASRAQSSRMECVSECQEVGFLFTPKQGWYNARKINPALQFERERVTNFSNFLKIAPTLPHQMHAARGCRKDGLSLERLSITLQVSADYSCLLSQSTLEEVRGDELLTFTSNVLSEGTKATLRSTKKRN